MAEYNSVFKDLLELLNREIALLKTKQSLNLEQYLINIELQHIVERALCNAIQACIDIGARLIAQNNLGKADSYHDIFDVLYKRRIIDGGLNENMHIMVGLRNALTHEYRIIRHEGVYSHLQKSLSIFQEFAKGIVKCIKEKSNDQI